MNFRTASRSEFDLAVKWAASEGWNPGIGDAEVFWNTDPEGFVCAEEDGEIIATGSVVSYNHFGFMGFFIVRPDRRGKGIGRDFWHWRKHYLQNRLEPEAAIGMDGVFDMQSFYAKGGFVFSHRNLRMEGVGKRSKPDPRLHPLANLDFEMVAEYDATHFGYRRDAFLRKWISMPSSNTYGLLENGRITGMGIVRECLAGSKIGPLFANDESTANLIFAALAGHAEDAPLYLDVPECNESAMKLAKANGMTEVFGCARMYCGPPPDVPMRQIYGITTFELG